jgi:hypothetical protein
MAFRKPVEDASGSPHPDAVWYPVYLTISHGEKSGSFLFYSYHNLASLAAGKANLTGPLSQKSYPIKDTEYLGVVGTKILLVVKQLVDFQIPEVDAVDALSEVDAKTALKNLLTALDTKTALDVVSQIMYNHAKAKKDTENPEGKDKPKVSFFENCEEFKLGG